MEQIFKKQLEVTTPLTASKIEKIQSKTTNLGNLIKENDVLLYAFNVITEENQLSMNLILLTKDEIDLYEYDEDSITEYIPKIIKIK